MVCRPIACFVRLQLPCPLRRAFRRTFRRASCRARCRTCPSITRHGGGKDGNGGNGRNAGLVVTGGAFAKYRRLAKRRRCPHHCHHRSPPDTPNDSHRRAPRRRAPTYTPPRAFWRRPSPRRTPRGTSLRTPCCTPGLTRSALELPILQRHPSSNLHARHERLQGLNCSHWSPGQLPAHRRSFPMDKGRERRLQICKKVKGCVV